MARRKTYGSARARTLDVLARGVHVRHGEIIKDTTGTVIVAAGPQWEVLEFRVVEAREGVEEIGRKDSGRVEEVWWV